MSRNNCINCGAPVIFSHCEYCGTPYSQSLCYTQSETTSIDEVVKFSVPFIEYKENKLLCGTEYHFNDGSTERRVETETLIGIDGTIIAK